MKLFIDDIREAPKGWEIARNSVEALSLLRQGTVEEISFDHDLGSKLTGYDVALWIEQQVFCKKMKPPIMKVHSANPVGAGRLRACIDRIYKQYNKNNKE